MANCKVNPLYGWNAPSNDGGWVIVYPEPEADYIHAKPKYQNMFGAGVYYIQDDSITWTWQSTIQDQYYQLFTFWNTCTNKQISVFTNVGATQQTAPVGGAGRTYQYGYKNAIIGEPVIKRIRNGLWQMTITLTNVHDYQS